MFPTVKVRLEGCEPDLLYYVFLDVVPVDDRRYRYVYNKSSWLTAGKAEPTPETRIYMHPDAPFPGRQLASQVISFEKAKLTNSDVDRTGHVSELRFLKLPMELLRQDYGIGNSDMGGVESDTNPNQNEFLAGAQFNA